MKKLLACLVGILSGAAIACTLPPDPLPGGQTRIFDTWAKIANKNDQMSFSVLTRVRLKHINGQLERTFNPGDSFPCTSQTFGSQPHLIPDNFVCQRFVADVSVAEYTPQTTGHPYTDARLNGASESYDFGVQRIQNSPYTPNPNTSEPAFRVPCGFSHSSYDDPIVYPGQPGKAHHHSFFGNVTANASTTNPAASGNSTCAGGTVNRSGYWMPSMIDTRFGRPVQYDSLMVYYKRGGIPMSSGTMSAPPAGLRMISGNMNATAPGGGYLYWCVAPGGASTGSGPSIPVCAVGSKLNGFITFPQCWDGVNLDSTDHKSHMAEPSGGLCPASHPVKLPRISFNWTITVRTGDDTTKWRLSSDSYAWSSPGGYSMHADWWNGWDQTVLQGIMNNCLNANVDCGVNLLGDGRQLF
jgi:hypothetical protein